MRMSKIPFGFPTIGLSLVFVACLVGCKEKPADLPPRTEFDEKGMPRGDQVFTPAEIHRDRPIGLDTAGLSPKPAAPAVAVAKAPAVDAKPAASPAPSPTPPVAPPPAPPVAKPSAVAATPAKTAPPPAADVAKPVAGAGDVAPGPSGDWVLQVNVHRSEADAQAQIAKLAKDGIPAYTVAFQSGEEHLSGSYWRVRVGRFSSRADAQKYGSSVLEPKGLKFWIDKKSNEAKQGT